MSDAKRRQEVLARHRRSISTDLRTLDARFRFTATDTLFINSIRQWQLGGIADWLANINHASAPRVILILHYTPFPVAGRVGVEAEEYRSAFAELAILNPAIRPRLFTDSDLLRDQFGLLTDLPIGLVPIPHCVLSPNRAEPNAPSGPIKIVYLGQARRNKGFGLLPDAIASAQAAGEGRGVMFHLQAADHDFTPKDWEALYGRLTRLGARLIDSALNEIEYEALLDSADVVIIPYLQQHYDSQTSGILAEAIGAGKPVIVPINTWMEQQVAGRGNATTFVPGDPLSLGDAIVSMVRNFDDHKAAAIELSGPWLAHHNAKRFIETIDRPEPRPRKRATA